MQIKQFHFILVCNWLNHLLSGSFSLGQSQGCSGSNGDGPLGFRESDTCCMTENCYISRSRPSCISCEATNMCSISWFKDGQPLPLLSHGINQNWYNNSDGTLINFDIQTADTSYIGVYSCEVSNRTTSMNKTFNILREERKFPGPPDECHIPSCRDQQQSLGGNATFHCSFCAEEYTSKLRFYWERAVKEDWIWVFDLNITGTRFTPDTKMNASQAECPAACLDSYLFITNVTSQAYGRYRLLAHIPSSNQTAKTKELELSPIPLGPDLTLAIILAAVVITLVVCLSALLWYKVHLEVKLFLKDRFGNIEEKGQRSHDAFIAYDSSSEEDRAFVLEFIRPKLMGCDYAVYVKDIDADAGASFANEILEAVEVSLRCVLVISPTFMSSRLMGLQVYAAMNQMAELQTKIIPILFGDLDEKKLRQVEGLSSLLSAVPCIRYKEGKTKKDKFVKRLLLRMPKRSKPSQAVDIFLNSTSDTVPLTP